ncbi:ABC transporter ATP-binding protein [Paenibacillus lautus]|uniref:ABC transporter ATP-binding protein n=1 Tax=Paenibacillus lautus TaxID=1401 RepID=UPI003D2A9B51
MIRLSDDNTPLKPINIIVKMFILIKSNLFLYVFIGILAASLALFPTFKAEGVRRLFNAVEEGIRNNLLLAALFLVIVFIFNILITVLRSWLVQYTLNRSVLDIQNKVLRVILNSYSKRIRLLHTGDKIQRLNDSTTASQDGFIKKISALFQQILSIIILGVYLTFISWQLMLGAIIVAIIVQLLTNFMAKPIHRWQSKMLASKAQHESEIQDHIRGGEVTRIYNLKPRLMDKWINSVLRTRDAEIRTLVLQVSSQLSVFVSYWCGQIYVLFMGAWMVQAGHLQIGEIAAFLVSFELLVYPISAIMNLWTSFQDTLGHARRVFEIFEFDDNSKITEDKSLLSGQDDIVFENIYFGYSGENHQVLEGLSLSFKKGTITALIGESGSGKSTIVKLLLGLEMPDRGVIYMGGISITRENVAEFRKNIGYVSQETALFNGTIYENIQFGRKGIDRDRVLQASIKAQAHPFIMKLPNQYETKIGEDGSTLSGGEKQRIALARALLNDPEILVFDEPTSALDSINEQMFQEVIVRIPNVTVIIIAHKLSMIKEADCIYCIDNGRIKECGNHEELISLRGAYFDMVQKN